MERRQNPRPLRLSRRAGVPDLKRSAKQAPPKTINMLREMFPGLFCGLLLAVVMVSGCTTVRDIGPKATPDDMAFIQRGLEEYDAIVKAAEHCVVDRADGISEVEAYKIAKDHLQAIGKYRKRVAFRPMDANECWLIRYPLSLIGGIDLLFEVSKKDGALKEKKAEPDGTSNDSMTPGFQSQSAIRRG